MSLDLFFIRTARNRRISLLAIPLLTSTITLTSYGERDSDITRIPPSSRDEVVSLEKFQVESERLRAFRDDLNPLGTRIGLTPGETPATIDVLSQEQIQFMGLRTAIEAYSAMPGVVAGNIPGEPGMTTLRGFSSGGAVSYLFDGIRAADSALVSRNVDTFNFERIEILKGPASVTHGAGALAGSINLVSKTPVLRHQAYDLLLSYGSFETVRLGLGANVPFGSKFATRADFSMSRSNGFVDATNSRTTALTTTTRIELTSQLSLSLSLDYFNDRYTTPYQAAPLLPLTVARNPSKVVKTSNGFVLDESIRERNYNVSDGLMQSDNYWARARATYRINRNWQFVNELGYYDAKRDWINSEDYSYSTVSGLLNRSTTKILHDHRFWSERAYVTFDGEIGKIRDRLAAGIDYNDTRFSTVRRFGTTTSVDPFTPERGYFPQDNEANFPGAGNRVFFDSAIATKAVFLDNAVNLAESWILVGGLRYENIDLDRRIDDLNTGSVTRFGRQFNEVSWRVGTVYDLSDSIQAYAQYNYAVAPVSNLVLSNVSRASFDLTTGNSIEVGTRAAFLDKKMTVTAALYQIEQENILTRDPVTPSLTIQGGTRESKGVELSLSYAALPNWQIDLNGTLAESEYSKLLESGGVDRSGNRPPNVPERILNLRTSYNFRSIGLLIGAGVRHVGDFYTDNANTIRVRPRTLLDAWIAYSVARGTLTLRGRNLTDEFYADWSGYSSTQVYVGSPVSADLTWTTRF